MATHHQAAMKHCMDSQVIALHPHLPHPNTIESATHPSQDHITPSQEAAANARTDKTIRNINYRPEVEQKMLGPGQALTAKGAKGHIG